MTPRSGWRSSEFWLALAAMAGKVATFLVTAQLIRTSDPNQLANTVTTVVTGIGTIVALTYGSNGYVKSRTDLKAQAMALSAGQPAARVVDLRPPRQPGVR